MLTEEEFNDLSGATEEVLVMHVTTNNLAAKEENQKLKLDLVKQNDHFVSWVIMKTGQIENTAIYIDEPCIKVQIDSQEDGISIVVDEFYAGINVEAYPELMNIKHSFSDYSYESGLRAAWFNTEDPDDVGEILKILTNRI